MAEATTKVVSFDPAKIPSTPTTPPKYAAEVLAQYMSLIEGGRGAGDGLTYPTVKEARSAANSIKRALRKFAEGTSTRTRIWSGDSGKTFQFALLLNTQPVAGNAARQSGSES